MESEISKTTTETNTNNTRPERPNNGSANNKNDNTATTEPPMNGEMPEMPDFSNCIDSEEEGTNCEMPVPPDGEEMPTGGRPGQFGTEGDGQFGGQDGFGRPGQGQFGELAVASTDPMSPLVYLTLGSGSLLLSIVIIYTCFSKFFHKKPGAVFTSGKRFTLVSILILCLTAGFIAILFFTLGNNYR